MSSKKYHIFADLVIDNAKIHTVDLEINEIRNGKFSFTTIEKGYVAAKEGKIIAVAEGDPNRWIGIRTQVIDAQGKVLIPGLVDSHLHAQFAGEGMLNINMRNVPSAEAMFALIDEHAQITPEGEFIRGANWNETLWNDAKTPTRADLDKISTVHPMYLIRICYRVAIVNSKALELAGITKDTPNPEGGTIGKDENGEPNGILFENSAMRLVQDLIPPLTEEQEIQAIQRIGAHLNENGITSVIDANLSFRQTRAYFQAHKQGKLSYRAPFMFYLDPDAGSVEYHLNRLDEMVAVTGFGNDFVKLNAIKVKMDGIPALGTACMRRNYKHMPETSGSTTITAEEMTEIALRAAKYHWQLGVHSIGDKATDIVLAAFEEADKKYGPIQENRNYLIHLPFPHQEQLEIMKKLNISAAIQPSIFYLMGEAPLLYEDQANLNQPAGLFFKNGIIVGGSSNHPVTPVSPFLGMYSAITRKISNGELWGVEHAITPEQALIMWTKNAAYFSQDENIKGSIEIGNFADFTLIDRDILTCPVEDIKNTKVEMTILDGKIVYTAELV